LTDSVLILARHGVTEANVRLPCTLQGLRPDSELIDAGLLQSAAVADALAGRSVVHVYCSPLRRSRRTAEVIAEALGVPLGVEADLVEADVGLWAGLTWEEVERRWPDASRAFHDAPDVNGYLGGEDLAQVCRRALPAAERLVERHAGETLLAVGHGVVNRVLLAHWLGLPLRYARRIPQDNAGLSTVEFRGGSARVRTVNAVDHLHRGTVRRTHAHAAQAGTPSRPPEASDEAQRHPHRLGRARELSQPVLPEPPDRRPGGLRADLG
jgi:broad specificity phosphatase PhoE